jgi:hypothetical protein
MINQAVQAAHVSVRPPDPFVCSVSLTPVERVVMTLIHLDPRLSQLKHRDQLRLLALMFDQSFRTSWVGNALTRLRRCCEGKFPKILSWAFDWPAPDAPVELNFAVKTICELSASLTNEPIPMHVMSRRLVLGLRLLGHTISESQAKTMLLANSKSIRINS